MFYHHIWTEIQRIQKKTLKKNLGERLKVIVRNHYRIYRILIIQILTEFWKNVGSLHT